MASKEHIQDALLKAKDLADLSATEGGKRLISALTDDVWTTVRILANQYTKLTHTEFIAHAASLSEKLSIISVLQGAPGDFSRAKRDLEEAIKEDTEEL